MNVVTKFNTDDEVLILHDDKLISIPIFSISVYVGRSGTVIKYKFKIHRNIQSADERAFIERPEEAVFAGTGELANSSSFIQL